MEEVEAKVIKAPEEIAYDRVSFVYSPKSPFKTEALKDVSFSFNSDEFIALIGRTGSGKSTIIEHLNALLVPTSGEVRIGEYINSADKKRRTKKLQPLRHKVGLVFQFSEYQLFEDTVEKDVAFGPRNFGRSAEEALEDAHEALSLVGLDESFYKRSPFELSGGEKRRAAIAGILAIKPDVLVLDEPTSGLDPAGAASMMKLFKEINESGIGIVLVTHDMEIVLGYAKKAIVVNEGSIARIAKPEELFMENLVGYGLEKPPLLELIDELRKKGLRLDPSKIKDERDLVKALKEKRG